MIQKNEEIKRRISIYFLIKIGFNIYDIKDILNISFNTVRNYINKYNIKYPYTFYQTKKRFGRSKGFEMSRYQKELRSKIFSGKNNPFYGKKHTQETRQKMSENHADFTTNKNSLWKGTGDLSGRYWCSIRTGAKNRNIDFFITKKYAWDLFLQQNKKCDISGIEIILEASYKYKSNQTASIDRIDSNKGYIKGNIHWVHKDINRMKSTYDLYYFIEICKRISKYNESK